MTKLPDRGRSGDADSEKEDRELGELYASSAPVPPTPAEAMWTEVVHHLPAAPNRERGSATSIFRLVPASSAVRWGLAAGFVLAMGVAIGRASVGPVEGPGVARAGSEDAQQGGQPFAADMRVREVFEVVERDRLGGVEPLLTMIAADTRSGRYDPQIVRWAELELTRTRLALDGPGAQGPVIRSLLQDLELILMQVASLDQVPEERAGEEMNLIAQGLAERSLLVRIRAVRTVGP